METIELDNFENLARPIPAKEREELIEEIKKWWASPDGKKAIGEGARNYR